MGEEGGAEDYKVSVRGRISVAVERRPWELVVLRFRGLRPPPTAPEEGVGAGTRTEIQLSFSAKHRAEITMRARAATSQS
ncbi:hypothetical protein AV530_019309 [Patagioenas fasciata monilis]|uniref:Uncharacterized protein n=1 Tax=Patagioenas fasciata monilis TaxID=372326 RepID=A0A1V4JD20_PATFA|nr:hypothetical protein AV530_019309 [Patagioenas fasciata monilis]